MRAFAHDVFTYPLPEGHRFPLGKYRLVREGAEALPHVDVDGAVAATWDEVGRVHTPGWIEKVREGGLDRREELGLGLPWSPELVERSLRATGATIQAARAALEDGVAANLGGGTHHAFADVGRGFCVLNDVVVALRALRREGRVRRVLVVDLDVHQGDGTAQILAGDDSVFTLSMHGETNFPFRKQVSDLDVALPDGTGDEEYLAHLDRALEDLAARFDPQVIIYLSGADAHENDRLGKLALTMEGMRARDERVFGFAERLGIPIAVAMAGGYGRDIDLTVELHLQTVRAASAAWRRRRQRQQADARA